MRLLIEDPASAEASDGDAILADLRGLMEAAAGSSATDDGASKAAREPHRGAGWSVLFRLPMDAMATGTNPLLLLDELRSLGDASVAVLIQDVPPLEAIDPAGCYIGWRVKLRTSQPRSAVEDVFMFVIDDMTLEIEPLAPESETYQPADVRPPAKPVDPREHPPKATAEQKYLGAGSRGAKNVDSVRVPALRLDELMDQVGELVIAQSRLKQIAAASTDVAVKSVAEEIERLSLELRDTTMGVRMLPIGQLFGRFRRLIHDLARDLGKQIDLVTIGEETELDKTVIERLNDPLIHLIRNSIDHGLEDPAGRIAAGKQTQGRITLAARHVGAEVLVYG